MISICSNLVACYNRESYCLVVDELDSGIYEYLLGECLEAMQEKAKGQLIFTSHNLRPLEVLENEFLIYTTVNPENRYIKSAYIKNTQNTRISYLRSIKLGGQKEKLYNETNIYEMELAMRRAGKVGLHVKKIILLLVEGPTDEDALTLIYSKLIKEHDIEFDVLHTDITADEDMTVKYIEERIQKKIWHLKCRSIQQQSGGISTVIV